MVLLTLTFTTSSLKIPRPQSLANATDTIRHIPYSTGSTLSATHSHGSISHPTQERLFKRRLRDTRIIKVAETASHAW